MSKPLIIVAFLFLPFALAARLTGQARIDSLVKAVPAAREDTNKVLLINKIAFAYNYSDPATGIKYAEQAVALSDRLGWEKGKAIAYNSIFACYGAMGNYTAARQYALRSMEINERIGDKRAVAVNLGNVANTYETQSDFTTALGYQFRSLKIREELNDKVLIGTSLMNIGNIYLELGNYKKQLEYHLAGLKIFQTDSDEVGMSECYANLGSSFQLQKKYDTAIKYYQKALVLTEKLGLKNQVATIIGNMGEAYTMLHNYDEAMRYGLRSLDISREIGDKEGEATALKLLGTLYLQVSSDSVEANPGNMFSRDRKGNLARSIQYLKESAGISGEINNLQLLADANEQLATAYKLAGNYKLALQSYEVFTRIKDTVFSNDNKVKVAQLETQREEALKNKQIELTRLTEVKKRNEQLLLLSGLAILLAAVVITRRAHDKQKKANKEKEALLKQKDDLMKEVHHRVKNNLQVIGSLLDLQQEDITDDSAKHAMVESTSRVRSISLVHQHLYQHDNVTAIDLSIFAADLIKQVTSIFKQRGQHITINNQIPATNLDIDTGIALGLILNELVTNSFKYVFLGQTENVIDISLQRMTNGYRLSYKDHGALLDPGILDDRAGLGMRIMKSLSKQLGGTFSYDPVYGTFNITFKDEAGRKMID